MLLRLKWYIWERRGRARVEIDRVEAKTSTDVRKIFSFVGAGEIASSIALEVGHGIGRVCP